MLWIPSHILTLGLRYAHDYGRAGVPTWPLVYGPRATRMFIAGANLLNALVLTVCALLLQIHPVALTLVLGSSLLMTILAMLQLFNPTEARNWLLFKVASIHMLLSMLLLAMGTILRH